MYNKGICRSFINIRVVSQRTVHEAKQEATAIVCPFSDCKKNEKKEAIDVSSSKVRSYEDIPGPKAFTAVSSFLRSLPYTSGDNGVLSKEHLEEVRHRSRDIVKLDKAMRSRYQIILFSPELSEQMYRQQGVWPERGSLELLQSYRESRPNIFNGQYGVAISRGKMWHDLRSKMNSHLMAPRRALSYVEEIDKINEQFVSRMRDIRDPKSLELPSYFNNELQKWTVEALFAIILNKKLGCLNSDLPKNSDVQTVINGMRSMNLLMCQKEMESSMLKMFSSSITKQFYHKADKLHEVILKYIHQAKEQLNEKITDNTKQPSILEKLHHELQVDEVTARVMSLDMLLAGVDTVGMTVGTVLYCLAANPDKQQKLRREAMMFLRGESSTLNASSLKQASYAKACVKEAQRLFSISIGIPRSMTADAIIGGYRIPKGVHCKLVWCGGNNSVDDNLAINFKLGQIEQLACHSVMSMNPQQFPHPEEYIPERWSRDHGEFPSAKTAHPFSCMPFGYGSRICIGKRFAEMEMETLILKIVRNFKFEWHHGPLKCRNRIVNIIDTPLQLKITDL